jgi:hypothetical protein
MKFIQRLKYYGIGFGIGLLLVFVFFGGRGCSWMPENRLKDELLHKIIVMNQSDYDAMRNKHLNVASYISMLKDGAVDFGVSIKHENPRFYLFSGEINGKTLYAQFEARNNDAFVSLLRPLSSPKITDKSMPKAARIVYFPNDTLLVAFDDNTQIDSSALLLTPRLVQDALLKNGRVDYLCTNLKELIKPIYCFSFALKGHSYLGKAIWYKNRILFKEISVFN